MITANLSFNAMGRTSRGEWRHATEHEMESLTWNYDQNEAPYIGHWSNFVVDDHTRVIVENLGDRQYCTRSLLRSVLMFETVEELQEEEYWLGRLYRVQQGELKTLVKSEDVGDTEFRRLYETLGGTANW